VILTEATARFLEMRLRGSRREHRLKFGSSTELSIGLKPFRLTLLPAGHILGSAMALIESDGGSLLYTGDFKLRRGLAAEMCEPRRADILITESTFGLPKYRFPGNSVAYADVADFCRSTLDHGETPVLLAYSLGKAQETLLALGDTKLPLRLHPEAHKLAQLYQQLGVGIPAYDVFSEEQSAPSVLVWPPGAALEKLRSQFGPLRVAVLTGWALDSGCRFQYRADAAFPVSDHADFDELLEMVTLVQPKQVFTIHGFAREFAHTLRSLGHNATAPGWHEQLALGY
jgi:Cft2 family RNA processing exonuclease